MGSSDGDLRELNMHLRLGHDRLIENEQLTGRLQTDLQMIRDLVHPSEDIVVHVFPKSPVDVALVYQTGLTDCQALTQSILQSVNAGSIGDIPALLRTTTPLETLNQILQGQVAVLVEGQSGAMIVPVPASVNPAEPKVERVVRGPHQAFTPHLPQNLALVRRLVQQRELRVEMYSLSPESRSQVIVAYVEGRAKPAVHQELIARLSTYQGQTALDVAAVKPALADDPLSPFPNVQLTERVDTTAAALLDGRYAVLTTGSAQALLLPTTFFDMMSSTEDQYLPRWMGNTNRLVRYAAAFTALVAEPLYIAVTSLHQEFLPTPLAFAIARSRSGVPLPVFAEVLLMALVIEVLREAAVRLPDILSQTISIVGALVIGQAVVQASLISGPVIVVVAFTALSSFVVPQYELAISIRLLRFPAMFAAGMLGLFGLSLYLLFILIHLARLESFGTPYLSPVAPVRRDQLEKVIRLPRPDPQPSA